VSASISVSKGAGVPVILSAENVTKAYPVRGGGEMVAVSNLSLGVKEGEFVCIVGASGCGKSTLLNMFAGFIQPTRGSVKLRGEPITAIEPRCGMMFQAYALFPWKTVRKNVEFPLEMQRVPRAERHARAERFIELVQLKGFEDRYPYELSGGMQQRASLARILAADPEVLLMDEPFAALDAMTRQVLQEELLQIQEKSRKTVLFITHNLDEALILADRIVVLSSRPGRVKAVIDNDLPRPRHVTVQLSPEYAALKAQVWAEVEDEVLKHVEADQHAARA
jgi:NitT/TauT family transport system ATP-binding protein